MEVISVENLTKTYGEDIHAVQNLELRINRGEIYGFLGPNGAGKSTSIKMIVGLLNPTSGSITVLGHQMPENFKEIVYKMGYVPQDLIYYHHLTVRENLLLFASMYDLKNANEIVQDLIELLLISNFADQRSSDLSGGQKRRLNLAIGLLHDPEILILDEPSAGMDPQSRNILWETIKKITSERKVTVILTTHLMETVDRVADRVGIIDHGSIIAEGTPEELKKKYGLGDILEIKLSNVSKSSMTKLSKMLEGRYPNMQVIVKGKEIRLSMADILPHFSEITSEVEAQLGKENIQSILMHENTLEDVFIHLTGRELRE